MIRLSVICIVKNETELVKKQEQLKNQTFQEFEFIGITGGTIPEAWNRGIAKAHGEILVFTETDAKPVGENWLAELVSAINDDKTIVKGLEITNTPLDFSNLAVHRRAFDAIELDKNFKWAEDTELFCRLKENGYKFNQLHSAPVIHFSKPGSEIFIRRSFRYGLYRSKMHHRFSDPVELASPVIVLKTIIALLISQIGFWAGQIYSIFEKKITSRRIKST
jgi:GT2 family glycosyltransferase